MKTLLLSKIGVFETILFAIYFIILFLTSLCPIYRILWCIESGIGVALFIFYLLFLRNGINWTKTSTFIIIAACIMQTIGGFYTFQNVPYGEFIFILGALGRNNFDRLGHLFCGLLSFPLLEIIEKKQLINSIFLSTLL